MGNLDSPTRLSLGGGAGLNYYFTPAFASSCNPACNDCTTLTLLVHRPNVLVSYQRRLPDHFTFFTEGSIGLAIATGLRLGSNFR